MLNNNDLNICKKAIKIGQAMTGGILLEASCNPAPGLVSPFSMGAHKDMNFLSFMLSTSAISPYFSLFGQVGLNWEGEAPLLEILRPIGISAEEQLIQITGGVNTQRGILFLGGIVAAVSGHIMKTEKISVNKICEKVSKVCEGIVDNELGNLDSKNKYTHGEKLFKEHGIRGIRGEVEDGLPSVKNISYPRFVKAMEQGLGLNKAMIDSLIHLIEKVEDTTVLSRVGMNGLMKAQEGAREAINKGSVYTSEGKAYIEKLDKYFIENNISPGGCADLLAVTVAIYILEGKNIDIISILKGYGNLFYE